MYFSQLLSVFGSAALVAANTVTFLSLDDTKRTVFFTPTKGHSELDSITVSGGANVTKDFPQEWIGNWHAVAEGVTNTGEGMLGEVTFQGWLGKTYFDVSAIVIPEDKDNVKEMWPLEAEYPTSGCDTFPCDNAYYEWDDVQTKVTEETDLVCTLGEGSSPLSSRDAPEAFSHKYVEGKF